REMMVRQIARGKARLRGRAIAKDRRPYQGAGSPTVRNEANDNHPPRHRGGRFCFRFSSRRRRRSVLLLYQAAVACMECRCHPLAPGLLTSAACDPASHQSPLKFHVRMERRLHVRKNSLEKQHRYLLPARPPVHPAPTRTTLLTEEPCRRWQEGAILCCTTDYGVWKRAARGCAASGQDGRTA